MRFRDSIFGRLLESINRRQFQTVVDRLNGDACDKSFKSWDHLVALIYAQLSGTDSLRAVVAGFNANAQHPALTPSAALGGSATAHERMWAAATLHEATHAS
jgi:Domain of unknown function (DUF4372)